jgi:hypothetical protein
LQEALPLSKKGDWRGDIGDFKDFVISELYIKDDGTFDTCGYDNNYFSNYRTYKITGNIKSDKDVDSFWSGICKK